MNDLEKGLRLTRLVGAMLVLALLAAACSRVPPGGEQAYAFGPVGDRTGVAGDDDAPFISFDDGFEFDDGAGVTTGSGAAVGAGGAATGGSSPGGSSPGGSSASPTGGPGGAGSNGGTGPGSPTGGGGGGGAADGGDADAGGTGAPAAGPPQGGTPVTGVEGNTIQLALTTKIEDCGDSVVNSDPKLNAAGRDMAEQFVGWWNEEVLADYGWQVEYQWVDDGGVYCPEKTRAAAQQIIREIQPFAVIGSSGNAAEGPIMADMVSRAGIPHIGHSFNTFEELNARKGYVFQTFIPAQLAYEYLEAYIVRRVRGTQTDNPTTGLPEDRVYGMAVPDLPEYRRLAGIMKQRLAGHGVDVGQLYFVSTDPGIAAQTALTTVNKMRSDGINSLIFDFFPNGLLSGVALTQNMARQNYLPELLIATYGIPIIDQTNDLTAWARAHGVTPFQTLALRSGLVLDQGGGMKFDESLQNVSENTEAYTDVWRRLGNNNDAGDGVEGWNVANFFEWMTILSVGLMGNPFDQVGGQLTRESFADAVFATAAGEDRRCAMMRFLGRDSPADFHWSQDDGMQTGFRKLFTTVYWVNERTLATLGYYESFDDYQFFDGIDALPAQGINDTATGYQPYYQEPIGLRPWIPCGEFGMAE